MPVSYLRTLTHPGQDGRARRHLACYLAFVAGAVNAGGLLAVRQYTSHMSGLMSSIADHLALGQTALIMEAGGAVLSFVFGAACTAVLVNWARRRNLQSQYALPLLMEAVLLLGFGLLGNIMQHHHWVFVPLTVSLLCFVMGLQNAMITKLSHAEIRTTHVTGMITDIGIELGKLFYWNDPRHISAHPPVMADRSRIRLLCVLIGMFVLGGVAGALGFHYAGYVATVPLAALLIALAGVPVLEDLGISMPRNA